MKKALLIPIMMLVSVGLKAGADQDLLTAANNNNIPAATAAIAAGANVNTGGDWPPLRLAARRNGKEIVKMLLDKGALVNAISSDKKTALMEASFSGALDVVKFLIQRGAKEDMADHLGGTALTYATGGSTFSNYSAWRKGECQKVVLFLKKYSKLSQDLLTAAEAGNSDGVTRALAAGANVDAKTKSGMTALMLVAIYCTPEVVQKLLDKNADVNASANDGYTALLGAVMNGHIETVKKLVDANADISAKQLNGKGILSWAIIYKKKGNTEIVDYLASRGASY